MAPQIRNLIVNKTQLVTPHMKRVTLKGPDLCDFPCGYEGGYVRVLFPKDTGDHNEQGALKDRFLMRSYTVRNFRNAAHELDLDFVLHGDSGPASKWAETAKEGDPLSIAGPGPVKRPSPRSDWVLFAGDMTSLPAIAVNLENLPKETEGKAIILIESDQDRIDLKEPPKFHVHWITDSDAKRGTKALITEFENTTLKGCEPFVWAAGEFELMRSARKYVKRFDTLSKDSIYVSSYWKTGETDEGMKKAKAALLAADN